MLIHNNTGGEDAKILKKLNEPAWNYQVVRFLDSKSTDIIPRKDKIWTMKALIPRIEKTLTLEKKRIPELLSLLKLEADTSKHKTIALSMHCFWTGEMHLGRIDGVVTTEAGWYDGHEVTLVTYHTDQLDLKTLLKKAAKVKCANKVYLQTTQERDLTTTTSKLKTSTLVLKNYRPAKASDQKKQISNTKFSKLKLTSTQATKVNAYTRTSPQKAVQFLTTKQAKMIGFSKPK